MGTGAPYRLKEKYPFSHVAKHTGLIKGFPERGNVHVGARKKEKYAVRQCPRSERGKRSGIDGAMGCHTTIPWVNT